MGNAANCLEVTSLVLAFLFLVMLAVIAIHIGGLDAIVIFIFVFAIVVVFVLGLAVVASLAFVVGNRYWKLGAMFGLRAFGCNEVLLTQRDLYMAWYVTEELPQASKRVHASFWG